MRTAFLQMAASPEVDVWHTVARRKKVLRNNSHVDARQAQPDVQPVARSTSVKHPIIKNGRLQEPPSTPSQHDLNVAEIDRTFSRLRATYTSSPSSAALQTLIHSHASSHAPITRAICLGNGPLHAPDSNWDRRRAANIQTATFLTLVGLLSGDGGIDKKPRIRCIFQEPLYSAADRTYLTTTLGCEVVDDPEALKHATEDSLIWGVHMYHSMYGDILRRITEPAMLVGTPWNVWDALPPDEDGRIAASLKGLADIHASAEYDLFAFPQDDGHYTFYDTGIYWRKKGIPVTQEELPAAKASVSKNGRADDLCQKTPLG